MTRHTLWILCTSTWPWGKKTNWYWQHHLFTDDFPRIDDFDILWWLSCQTWGTWCWFPLQLGHGMSVISPRVEVHPHGNPATAAHAHAGRCTQLQWQLEHPPVLAVWQWKQLGAPRSGSPVLESRDGTGSRSLMLMDTDGPQDLHRIGWFGQEGKEGDRQTDRRDTDRLMYVHTYPSSYLDRWTNR